MSDSPPLVVFDTNVLLDAFLEQQTQAVPIIQLAGDGKIELLIPRYVAEEFRGTTLRKLRRSRHKLQQIRENLNGLEVHAEEEELEAVRSTITDLDVRIEKRRRRVDTFRTSILRVAREYETTTGIFQKGYLRWLGGHPPDKEREGLKNCMIFEIVMALGREEQDTQRPLKVLATADDDFNDDDLEQQLREVDFELATDINRLYGRLRELVE